NNSNPGFMYAAEAKQKLPSLTSDEFFLFRPDGNNSYNASRESLSGTSSSAVPEPSSLLLVTAAIGTSAWWHRRRRQRLTQRGAY
ncbi:MAG: PEP-CTERM sorting domain-containing protein, partial [bacterium]